MVGHKTPNNIVLIGMPGAGKSTVGVLLAKLTSRGFVDTDIIIQTTQGRSLQSIVDADGYLALRRIEEDILISLDCHNHVIATGGSAVYSNAAMEKLKSSGIIVFLKVDINTIEQRIRDFMTRGLAKRPDQSLQDLFAERSVLYNRHADVTVECIGLTPEDVCARIIHEIMIA